MSLRASLAQIAQNIHLELTSLRRKTEVVISSRWQSLLKSRFAYNPVSAKIKQVRQNWPLIAALAAVLLFSIAVLVAIWEAPHKVIILDSIVVPNILAQNGLPSEVLTQRAKLSLVDIEHNSQPTYRDRFATQSEPFSDQLSTTLGQNFPDFEIKPVGKPFPWFVETVRRLEGNDPAHLVCEITLTPDQRSFQIDSRLMRRSIAIRTIAPITIPIDQQNSLADKISQGFAEIVNPYLLGLYLLHNREFAQVYELSDRMLSQSSNDVTISGNAYLLQAMSRAKTGNYTEANIILNRLLAKKTIPPDIHDGAGYVYLLMKDFSKSETEMRKSLAGEPSSCGRQNNLAAVLVHENRISEAEAIVKTAIAADSVCTSAHSTLATILARQNKMEQASAEYEMAISLDDKNADTHNNLGLFLEGGGKLEEAATEITKATVIDPKEPTYHSNLSNIFRAQGNKTRADLEVGKALELDPFSPATHTLIGFTMLSVHDYDGAQAQFIQALKYDMMFAEAHNGLGNILSYHQHNLAAGEFEIKKAIRFAPDEADPYASLGWISLIRNKSDIAFESFTQATTLDSTSASAHAGLADVWLRRSQNSDQVSVQRGVTITPWIKRYCFDKASEEVRIALALTPHQIDALNAKASLMRLLGNGGESERLFRYSIETDPAMAGSHEGLAMLFMQEERFAESINEFQEAIRLDQRNIKYRVDLGQAYLAAGSLDSAAQVLKDAVKIDDADGAAHFWLGETFFKIGRVKEAIAEIQRANLLEPNNPLGHDQLAEIYTRIGKADLAKEERKEAHEITPSLY